MTKALYSLGLILSLLSISYNAIAHSGMAHSSNMHSMLHIITAISVGLALMAIVFFLVKRFPKVIKRRVKK